MKKIALTTSFKLPQAVQDIFTAFRLIQWPKPKEILINLLAVFVISAIIGAYLWLLDLGFGQLRNVILFN